VAQTAKIFKNGRSQAVRLPKEFRFEGDEVEIRRDPVTGAVLLEPKSEPQEVSRRKKPVAQVGVSHTPLKAPTPGSRKLSLDELYSIFDQAKFPENLFEREVHPPRKLKLF
jgi:virulence-associated protein VagC